MEELFANEIMITRLALGYSCPGEWKWKNVGRGN